MCPAKMVRPERTIILWELFVEEEKCDGVSHQLSVYDDLKGLLKETEGQILSDSENIMSDVKLTEEAMENTAMQNCKTYFYRSAKNRLMIHLYKAESNFEGLNLSASNEIASSVEMVKKALVEVNLPKTLPLQISSKENRTIVFCLMTAPENFMNKSLLHGKMVGVSIGRKNVKGLADPIKITFNLVEEQKDKKEPECHFFNFSTNDFHKDGCNTEWKREERQVICSCDHLTYFSVLLVNRTISEKDSIVLTYITLIGCSISLFFLVVTVFLFIGYRKKVADVTLKVHMNLVMALIMLNIHFLASEPVASLPNTGPCVYLAVLLHCSLLATFTWMAIEGFHLYMMLVRVFNIYIKRYLVKLGLVGWGLPAVVVIVIAITDKDIYQKVTLSTTANSTTTTEMCYPKSEEVKIFNMCFFGLVWFFNFIILGMTCKVITSLRNDQASDRKSQARKDICTILGITCLLGITWGLVFFSFGHLPTPALYLFCILNSLQGFFISLWIYVSKWRASQTPGNDSQVTRSTDM
ncbi:hypothetical protein AGOR_G00168230 [Albula goreensis]|uniref:Uncharacterized protein n=1 Tax=Albula goreensis TaxID=1534307 RepID=A0A8T3D2P4_9TELE|nr:hypothetical protein AGOR_G00168230 [Albula goreensis]